MISHSTIRFVVFSLLLSSSLIYWGLTVRSSFLFITLFILWMNMMLYAFKEIEKRSILFAFGIAFFVFLIGREFLEQYSLMEIEDSFDININNHLYYSLIISIIGVWLGFTFSRKVKKTVVNNINWEYTLSVRKKAKMAFFLIIPFALLYRIVIVVAVIKIGYYGYYTEFAEYQSVNIYVSILNKLDVMLPVAFCSYLATLPSKNEMKGILIIYLIYLLTIVFGGQRGPFILGILLLFIFVTYMQGIKPHENWFKRKYLIYCLVLIPCIACVSSFVGSIRLGNQSSNFFDGFFNFFYDQGVTSYVVKRAYEYEHAIPKDIYLFQFMHSGILAKIFGIPVYNGNTIEHATLGGSFAHALAYVIMGDAYLMGGGTGSSYIAELFYDFGYIGVFIGSFLYGYILSLVYNSNSLFTRAMVFIVVTQILWACRSSFVGFLILLFTPSTILVIMYIFFPNKKIVLNTGHKK